MLTKPLALFIIVIYNNLKIIFTQYYKFLLIFMLVGNYKNADNNIRVIILILMSEK